MLPGLVMCLCTTDVLDRRKEGEVQTGSDGAGQSELKAEHEDDGGI